MDNTPPAVSITAPANNSALREIVDITADIHDTYLADTTISINSTAVSSTSGYTWDTTAYPDGWYNITATAADMAENTGGHEIWVEVDNTPPELYISELNLYPTIDNPEYSLLINTENNTAVTVNSTPIDIDDDGVNDSSKTMILNGDGYMRWARRIIMRRRRVRLRWCRKLTEEQRSCKFKNK